MRRFTTGEGEQVLARILPFRAKQAPQKDGRKRVVLLQGPVGPFFSRLQRFLGGRGCDVWRVCFNAGDRFYSRREKRIVFNGDLKDWERWFNDFVRAAEIDAVVLFGSAREIHVVARRVAKECGVRVISLEEGYIRPGFISMESGGNNAGSPLAGRMPPKGFAPEPSMQDPGGGFKSFNRMSLYGTVYYSLRTFFTFGKQKQLFHRPIAIHPDAFCWLRNGWRRIVGQARNFSQVERLLEHCDRRYYIVPLQVEADMQLQAAALGWSLLKLISATLKSFSRHAPAGTRLVYKVHPLERGHHNYGALIRNTAEAYGIQDRVDIVDIGSMGLLARHAAGMITINSTSGLSAIFHGIPLLVIGEAIYANPALATCAHGQPDFDSFWTCRHVADKTTRLDYLSWLRQEALVRGDFYDPKGIEAACSGVLGKLRSGSAEQQMDVDERAAC